MVTIYDVDVNVLVNQVAEELKHVNDIKAPEWAVYVKTGNHKERPPTQENWWHLRAGAVLLKVHKLGPVGVSKLRVKYGGKKNRGHKPDRFVKGSGSIIRKVLQQLEKAGLIAQVALKKEEKGRRGRIITGKGMKLLNVAAKKAAVAEPKKATPKPVPAQKSAQNPSQKPVQNPSQKPAQNPSQKMPSSPAPPGTCDFSWQWSVPPD